MIGFVWYKIVVKLKFDVVLWRIKLNKFKEVSKWTSIVISGLFILVIFADGIIENLNSEYGIDDKFAYAGIKTVVILINVAIAFYNFVFGGKLLTL
jgi:hypothetical protein